MAAGRSFDVAAVATAGEGGTAAVVLTHSTPALQDAFPQMTTVACSPAKMAPGYTLMSLDRNNPGEYFGGGYLVVLDSQSRVVWYLDPKTSPQKVSRTDDGNLRFVRGVEGIQEISMLGDVVQEWWADELGIDTLHHRFSGLPGGNLLVLDTGHPGTEHATRAVEYDLDFDLDDDGVHWKASEVWSWGEPEKLYDGGPGMVSILANKNVLLLEGSVIANPGISPLDPANSTWVRLVELDRSIQPNEVVYELHLKEKAPESPVRWSSLSVSRIDTLYPQGYVVAPVP